MYFHIQFPSLLDSRINFVSVSHNPFSTYSFARQSINKIRLSLYSHTHARTHTRTHTHTQHPHAHTHTHKNTFIHICTHIWGHCNNMCHFLWPCVSFFYFWSPLLSLICIKLLNALWRKFLLEPYLAVTQNHNFFNFSLPKALTAI